MVRSIRGNGTNNAEIVAELRDELHPVLVDLNRWKRWSDKGVFAQMLIVLAAEHGEEKTVMIDATYLKARRTASSLGVRSGGSENSPVDCFPDGRDTVA